MVSLWMFHYVMQEWSLPPVASSEFGSPAIERLLHTCKFAVVGIPGIWFASTGRIGLREDQTLVIF